MSGATTIVRIENERLGKKKAGVSSNGHAVRGDSEQWDRLLGTNGRTCSIVSAAAASQLGVPCRTAPLTNPPRRTSTSSSLFGSFQRSIRGLSIGSKDDKGAGHVFSRYRQSRLNARQIRKRVVFKHGDCNVTQGNMSKRSRKYLQDIFTTLVDAQWRWTACVFAMNFLLSWLAFATLWFIIVYIHGDLLPENMGNDAWIPCITNINSFTSCFLFSVETQHTIGYGGRTTTEECAAAIFVMCLQSITGVMIQAFMVGVVFTKLSRPKKRTQTLLFSRNAVICHRDGVPCLMFRVGDMRKSHIIEAHVRAQLIKHKVTGEGENLPFYQTELKVGGDGREDKIFFIWPTTIVHKIDRHSPLYNMTSKDLRQERFEIVVVLEGIIESTGMTTQARSSYLPAEILWGHRFESLVTFRKESCEYEVDYNLFNHTKEVDTPTCSAKELEENRILSRNGSKRGSDTVAVPLSGSLNGGVTLGITRSPSRETLSSMASLTLDETSPRCVDSDQRSMNSVQYQMRSQQEQQIQMLQRWPSPSPIPPVTITAPTEHSGSDADDSDVDCIRIRADSVTSRRYGNPTTQLLLSNVGHTMEATSV